MRFKSIFYTELSEEARLLRVGLGSTIPLSLAVIAQVWVLWAWGLPFNVLWPTGILAYLLALLAVTDTRTHMLPLSLVAVLAGFGVALNLHAQMPLWQILAGTGVAWLGALGVGVIGSRWAGRPALGAGDVWLAGALGAVLGLPGLAPWLLAVAGVGAIQALWAVGQGGGNMAMPFAPALVFGAWLALLYGDIYYRLVLP